MEIIGSAKIGDKFLTTIPKEVRERIGLERGDFLVFVDCGDKIAIEKGQLTIESPPTPWVKFRPPEPGKKLTDKELKEYARRYFEDFLTTYKNEAETRYSNLKGSMELYKNLPVKVTCVINTAEDTVFYFFKPSDSGQDEIEVEITDAAVASGDITRLFEETGAVGSIHVEFSSIGTFLSISPHIEANSLIVKEIQKDICNSGKERDDRQMTGERKKT